MLHGHNRKSQTDVCCSTHLDVLWSSGFNQDTRSMLHTPSDDHLLCNPVVGLAYFPDDGVLQCQSKRVYG